MNAVSAVTSEGICAPAQKSPLEAIYKEALKIKDSGHPLEARKKLQWLCSQPNATAPMYCALADTYVDFEGDNSSESQTARSNLFIALQKDPQCGHAYNCLAQFANLKGDFPSAAQFATKALAVKQPFPGALRQRALAYSHMNRLEDAIKDQQAFIDRGFKLPVNYMLLGDLQMAVKKNSDAEASYRTALSSGAQYQDRCFNLLLKCLRLQGKDSQVIAEISKRLAKDPTDPAMMDLRGQCEFKMKNYKDALRDCSAAIKESPLSMYYDHRAAVYDAMGQKQLAADDRAKSKANTAGELGRL